MTKEWEGREHYWDSLPKIGPIEGIVSMEYSANLANSGDADNVPINTERRVIATSSALKRALVCFPSARLRVERLQLIISGSGYR